MITKYQCWNISNCLNTGFLLYMKLTPFQRKQTEKHVEVYIFCVIYSLSARSLV